MTGAGVLRGVAGLRLPVRRLSTAFGVREGVGVIPVVGTAVSVTTTAGVAAPAAEVCVSSPAIHPDAKAKGPKITDATVITNLSERRRRRRGNCMVMPSTQTPVLSRARG